MNINFKKRMALISLIKAEMNICGKKNMVNYSTLQLRLMTTKNEEDYVTSKDDDILIKKILKKI